VWQEVSNEQHNLSTGFTSEPTDSEEFIGIDGHRFREYEGLHDSILATFNDREFETKPSDGRPIIYRIRVVISEDGQAIVEEVWGAPPDGTRYYWKKTFRRIK